MYSSNSLLVHKKDAFAEGIKNGEKALKMGIGVCVCVCGWWVQDFLLNGQNLLSMMKVIC